MMNYINDQKDISNDRKNGEEDREVVLIDFHIIKL